MYKLIKNIEIGRINVFVSERSRIIMPTFYLVTQASGLLQVSSESLRHRFPGAAPLLGPLAPSLTAVSLRAQAESLSVASASSNFKFMTEFFSIHVCIWCYGAVMVYFEHFKQFLADLTMKYWRKIALHHHDPLTISAHAPQRYWLKHRDICVQILCKITHASFSADQLIDRQRKISSWMQRICWLVYRATIFLLCQFGSLHYQPITHRVSCL